MRQIVVAFGLLCLAAACTADLGPELDTHGQAITEGVVSSPGAFPETVFLWLGGGACTGTLVAPQVVLTARHCLQGTNSVDVYFGNTPDDAVELISSVDLLSHPETDIGMIKLATPAQSAMPVPIHKNLTAEHIGREVLIVGFGETQGAGAAGIKREGVTKIDQLTGDAMVVGAEGADTCFGDSGGPTFLDEDGVRYVAAVTSSGTGNDCREALSINIRTDSHHEWIQDYIDVNSCGVEDGNCQNDCGMADPDCGDVGAVCVASSECQDNLCATVADDSLCTHGCATDSECPEGWECRDGSACWPVDESGGGCSTTGGGSGSGAVLVLIALGFAGRRRER